VIGQQEGRGITPWKNELRDAILVYGLLFISGSHIYNQSPNKYLILIFIISVLAWALFSDRKINDRFVLYVCVYTGLLLLIHLYTDKSLSFSSVIASTMKLLIAYLILKTVGKSFLETYIKVVVVLAGISLFGYLSDSLLLFDGLIQKLPRVGDLGYEGIFYLFRFQTHIDRNNSIFFEPGAYQIFLNVALFMLFFTTTRFSLRRKWVYILILLVTLLTTFSTTGYMIFGALFCLLMIKSDMVSRQGKLTLLMLLVLAIVGFSVQFQSVMIKKINKYMAIQDITDQQDLRSFDMLVDLEIFKKHIFGVGHDKYFEEVSAIGLIKEGHASSNGLTMTLAIYGLPFSLFLFASYYWFFRKFFRGVLLRIVPFGAFLIFLFSESYYVFAPFCLAIIAAIFVYDPVAEGAGMKQETETA
jgi:hypothetical protein